MFITTKAVYDIETGIELLREWEGYDYSGPIDECKGDPTAKAAEQQQLAFNTQLMSIFQQQFSKQSAITDYLTAKMKPIIDAGGTGLSPEALTAMRTSATDTISTQYNNAQKALNAHLTQAGESGMPSGVTAQLDAALLQQQASETGQTQNQITLSNEQLKQQNYWNATNVLNGQAATMNPLGYAGTATQGGDTVANLSQAVTAANKSGLLGALGGAVGGLFGAAGQAGGFGKLFCWVAAKTFNGWLDPRTIMVRNYLLNDFGKRWYGIPIVQLYAKYGEWISNQRSLMFLLKPVMYSALENARA